MKSIKEYELIQQTPMIHFQYKENGACIRATELKPKLDKFIIEKYKKGHNGQDVPDIWKIGWKKEKKKDDNENKNDNRYALNYKVCIEVPFGSRVQKSKTIERDIAIHELDRSDKETFNKEKNKLTKKHLGINGMYFGNMVNSKQKHADYIKEVEKTYKETVFYNDSSKPPIGMRIVCVIPELLDYIDDYIAEFFAVTNFGTRQDKGFGCFRLRGSKNDGNIEKQLKNNGYLYIKAVFDRKDAKISLNEGFKIASAVYSVMKGGINAYGVYIKGYIQRQYLDDIGLPNIGSDKAYVKSKILPRAKRKNRSEDEPMKPYDDYKYVRALLGVADHVEYKDSDKIRQGNVTIESAVKDLVQRFKSFITIKIDNNAVYFILTEDYKLILDQEFLFTAESGEKGTIKVPNSFDRKKFKTDFINYFNSKKTEFSKDNSWAKVFDGCSAIVLN